MKKVTIIFLFLFLISLASAAPQLELSDTIVQPGETLFGKITIPSNEEFVSPIYARDIVFLEGRKKVFVEHDIIQYNNTYYFYAYITREENLELKIENILYKLGNEIKEITLQQNLTIKNNLIQIEIEELNETTNETYTHNETVVKILSVKPGFYSGSKQPEFTLENKGNTDLNISYQEGELFLIPDEKVKATLQIQTNQTLSFLEFITYRDISVPIIYLSPETIQEGSITILKTDPPYLHVNLIASQEKTETIELFNFIEQEITDILITSNLEVMEITNLEELESLKPRETKNISLDFDSDKTGFTEGEIAINYTFKEEDYSLIIPIFVYILPEDSTEQDLENIESEDFTTLQTECTNLGGTICEPGQSCDGDEEYIGVFCCLANCESSSSDPDDNGSGWGWLIGVLILVVLAVVGFLAYRKFKKVKPIAPEKKLEETGKIYEDRIKGGLSRT